MLVGFFCEKIGMWTSLLGLLLFFPRTDSWEILLVKKLEIEKPKTTFIISVLKVVFFMVLVFSISNFFINEKSQGRKLSAKKQTYQSSLVPITGNDFMRL